MPEFCSLTARWNLNIIGRTEDRYFQLCPPGTVDHACGMLRSVSFSCKSRIVEKRRSSDPQTGKSLGTGPRHDDCMLAAALGIKRPGRGRRPLVMTSIPVDINSGKTLARKELVSAEGIESALIRNYNNLDGSRWHPIRCFQCKALRPARKRHGRISGFLRPTE